MGNFFVHFLKKKINFFTQSFTPKNFVKKILINFFQIKTTTKKSKNKFILKQNLPKNFFFPRKATLKNFFFPKQFYSKKIL